MKKPSIHNNFFSDLFSDERNVRDFLSAKLPVDVRDNLNLSKIVIDSENYTEADGHEHRMDLLIHTETKNNSPADVYILFEHKSSPDNYVSVQLLRYMAALWRQDSKNNQPLRLIIPLVFYHGKNRWRVPDSFHSMFDCEESFRRFIPSFTYHLFDTAEHDLTPGKNPKLRKNVELLSSLLAVKSVMKNDIEGLRAMLRFWQENNFLSNTKKSFFILQYAGRVMDVEKKQFGNIIEEELREGGDIMPTVAEQWMNEARQQGARTKAIETCKKLLRMGMDPSVVSDATGLPIEKVFDIQKSLKKSK